MFRWFCTAPFLAMCVSTAAQSDRYFPNVGAQLMLTWPCMDPFNGPWTAYESYTFTAEPTVELEGLEWGQLQPPGSLGLITVVADQVLYHGFTENHVPPDTTVVLYDFGLAEGDTAYYDEYYGFGHAVVQTIDTVEVVGRPRRVFHLNNGDTWLEGIGSLMGLYRPWYVTPLGCDHPTYSYCAYYVDEDGNAYTVCSADLPLGLVQSDEVVTKVYPNPNDGRFTISTTEVTGTYRVIDAQGKEHRRGSLQGDQTVVDLTSAAPGLYLVEVNGVRTKLIIE